MFFHMVYCFFSYKFASLFSSYLFCIFVCQLALVEKLCVCVCVCVCLFVVDCLHLFSV